MAGYPSAFGNVQEESPLDNPSVANLVKDKVVLPASDLAIAIADPYLTHVRSVLSTVRDVIESPRNQRFVVRFVTWVGILSTGLFLASLAYIAFYLSYVPALGYRQELYLQYGQGSVPFAAVDLSPPGSHFALDQAYDVTVEMVVPNSGWNIDIGNFMVGLELKVKGQTVLSSERPSILPHKEPLQRYLSIMRFIDWPVRLAFRGPVMPDSLVLAVPMMEKAYIDRGRRRVDSAVVTIGRKDRGEWGEKKGEIRSYSTSIRFDAHFEGLRYFMYYYPIPTFFVFASIFLFWEIVAALVAYILISKPFSSRDVNVIVDTAETLTKMGQKAAPQIRRAGQEIKREAQDGAGIAETNVSIAARAPRRGARLARGETDDDDASIKSESEDDEPMDSTPTRATEEEESSSLWSVEDAPAGGARTGTYGTGREQALDPRRRIKGEDDGDLGTVAGSSTTRPTQRSFGPTLSTSSTTAESARPLSGQRRFPGPTVSTEASETSDNRAGTDTETETEL